MLSEEKKVIEHFAHSLGAHDPWQWTGTCVAIMNEVDFDAPAELTREGDKYYSIVATMKNGRQLEMGYHEGGWSLKYAKPGERLTMRAPDDANEPRICLFCGTKHSFNEDHYFA